MILALHPPCFARAPAPVSLAPPPDKLIARRSTPARSANNKLASKRNEFTDGTSANASTIGFAGAESNCDARDNALENRWTSDVTDNTSRIWFGSSQRDMVLNCQCFVEKFGLSVRQIQTYRSATTARYAAQRLS